jgi:divalent metal cation (Fe/Co/Zn/Cd) transporter
MTGDDFAAGSRCIVAREANSGRVRTPIASLESTTSSTGEPGSLVGGGMPMSGPGQDELLRSGSRVSATSAAWTFAASLSAIFIGLGGESVALVAFGVVGLLDCAGSVALVAHFKDARSGGNAEHTEQIALRVITFGLVAVGLATAVVSVNRLRSTDTTSGSLPSIILAAASLLVLSLLSVRKRHVSIRLPSHPLHADSHLSAVGAILAAVTLAGTAASRSLNWWWADPVAALAIALGAIGLGMTLRHEP